MFTIPTFYRRYWVHIWITGATLLTALLYRPGLDGPFLLDDQANIFPTLPRELSLAEIIRILSGNLSGPTGRPISVFSFLINAYLFGLSPFSFKAVNLFIHLCNGLLIGSLTFALLSAAGKNKRQYLAATACLTATLWLLHPMQLSAVLYCVQRMTQLSCFFSLLSLLLYIKIRTRLIKGGALPVTGTFALAITLLMALLSKENGALTPLLILLSEFFFLKLKSFSSVQRYYLWTLLFFFCIMPLFLGCLYILIYQNHFLIHSNLLIPSRDFTLQERLLSELNVLVYYLQNILFPRLSGMSLFLDGFPVSRHLDADTVVSGSILLVLFAAAILTVKRYPILSFGIFFFFAGHLMESTIIPLELAFEHRNYLPIFGMILPISYYLVNSETLQPVRLKAFIIVSLILILSITTLSRSYQWADKTRLYSASLIRRPHSFRVAAGIADLMLAKGELGLARFHLEKAEALIPKSAGPTIHRLMTYCSTNEIDLAGQLLEKAVKRIETGYIDGFIMDSINKLQLRIMADNCPVIQRQALIRLTAATFKNSNYNDPDGKFSLMHARSLNLAGVLTEAEIFYKQAVTMLPIHDRPPVLVELGIVQLKLNKAKAFSTTQEQLISLHNPPFLDTAKELQRLAKRRIELINK